MKFSILVACFNKYKFIKECIDSIISQTYSNWEAIVVDDCSCDRSYSYLSSIKDSRVTVIRNSERQYCSSTYATALKYATGDICGIVDGDDVLFLNAIETIIRFYNQYPDIDYIYTQHKWCNKNLLNGRKGLSSSPKDHKSFAQSCLEGRHCFSHWRTFRTFLRDRGELFPKGLEVSVDKNLGFSLEELGRGAFLPIMLYYYRYYKGNMSLIQGKRQKAETLRMAKSRILNRKRNNIATYPVVKIRCKKIF